MKKIFALILAVALFAVSAASADETQGYAAGFSALILAVEDGTLLVEDVESQTQYEVHLNDQSQIISDGPLYEGNFVTIQYDGKATRSDPAQITAGCVTRFTVSGPVAEISEQDNTLLVDDKLGSQVLVRLPDVFKAGDYEGCYVVVCFSGAMTMSLPGQVNALTVDSFYAKYGVVTSLEDGQMMIDSEGTPWQVNFDEKTRGQNMAQIGDTVRVLYNGMELRSNPGQVTAQVVEIVSEGSAIEGRVLSQESDSWMIETDDGQVQINLIDTTVDLSGAAVGDTVRVVYSGAVTRSLPPQIGALTITPAE